MNLFEVLYFGASIVFTVIGASVFSRFGIAAGIGGGVFGFFFPFLLGQVLIRIDEILFRLTPSGRRRRIAQLAFSENYNYHKIVNDWRRPQKAKDGSLIVIVYYFVGNIIPTQRAFFRFTVDSMEPEEISVEEASKLINVPVLM